MGLPMDDLHNPTVPSGPTTAPASSSDPAKDKRSLLELIDAKVTLEEELFALGSVLESVGCPFTALFSLFPQWPHTPCPLTKLTYLPSSTA